MLGATAVLPASATGAAALGATAILPEGAAGAPAPGSGAAGAGATRVAPPPAIPGYDLLELIGRGGMGEVWKARQLSLGRLVAVKILSRELASDLDFIRRFEKEASALAALSHPNIVQIIDRGACDEGRIWFFAMEFCEGRPLRALLEERRLAPAQALRLLARVTRAIESAHRRGVIHRDLKPENVLVDEAGEPKVVDFGLAGLRQPAAVQLTRPATSMGTLHYMAPEQRRDARTADERADLYSLGVMIYEALVGDVPVGRFKLPSEKCPGLDGRLDKIVTKALQPEPEARYGTAGELAAELERVAEAAAEVRALRRVPSPQGDSWRRLGWIAATVAAAALLARFFLSGS